jgi:polyhydroxyalkanoate synthesis regulator phasin
MGKRDEEGRYVRTIWDDVFSAGPAIFIVIATLCIGVSLFVGDREGAKGWAVTFALILGFFLLVSGVQWLLSTIGKGFRSAFGADASSGDEQYYEEQINKMNACNANIDRLARVINDLQNKGALNNETAIALYQEIIGEYEQFKVALLNNGGDAEKERMVDGYIAIMEQNIATHQKHGAVEAKVA